MPTAKWKNRSGKAGWKSSNAKRDDRRAAARQKLHFDKVWKKLQELVALGKAVLSYSLGMRTCCNHLAVSEATAMTVSWLTPKIP